MKPRYTIPIAAVGLLVSALVAWSETEVVGAVSGRWNLEGSPYLVVGSLFVRQGQSLTIDPGVEVIFMGDYIFRIAGGLEALGEEEDSIRFGPEEDGEPWGG